MEMSEPMGTTGAGSIHTCPLHSMFAAPAPKREGSGGARGLHCSARSCSAPWDAVAARLEPAARGSHPPGTRHPAGWG